MCWVPGIAHSSGCVPGTSAGCGEELLSWLDANMQMQGKWVRLPIYAIQNDVTGIVVPGSSGSSILVSAAEKQGTKDQYKTRNRYLDATDCGDKKTFGREVRFTGESGENYITEMFVNTLNPEFNPMCSLLTFLGAHHFLHVSRIRVKSLTLRRLMSYIYIYIYIWSTHSWCF